MNFCRALRFFILPVTFLAAAPLVSAAEVESSGVQRRVYFTPVTPLDEILLYSLDPASPTAMRLLEAEVGRLYSHATSLPSGPDRRAFESRIYQLEKRLTPLQRQFDADSWVELRAAVRREWESVQAALPSSKPSAPVAVTNGVAPADRS